MPIEPTDEMVRAWRDGMNVAAAAAVKARAPLSQTGDIARAGLAAVFALLERDYEVTPRPCQWCGTPPGHHYLSTGCLHGEHDYCASMTGHAGDKRPAQCKFCSAPCQCPCHRERQ